MNKESVNKFLRDAIYSFCIAYHCISIYRWRIYVSRISNGCNILLHSNIQLCISPSRDLAYFYPFLYTIILSCIQLSGIATGYSI